jgi:hypothetical protein
MNSLNGFQLESDKTKWLLAAAAAEFFQSKRDNVFKCTNCHQGDQIG